MGALLSVRRACTAWLLLLIAGTVPSLSEPIVGCAFAPRCRYATERCSAESPPLEEKGVDHFAACWEHVDA